MNRPRKPAVLMGTLAPMLPIAFVITYGVACAVLGLQGAAMAWLGPIAALAAVALLAVLLGYAWQALHNRWLSETGRGVWILALMKLSPVAVPLYWYRNVWQDAPVDVVFSEARADVAVDHAIEMTVAAS